MILVLWFVMEVIVFCVFLEFGFFWVSLVILDSWRLFVVFYVLYFFDWVLCYEVGCFFVIVEEEGIFLNVEGRDFEVLNFFDKVLVGNVIGVDVLGLRNFCIVECGIFEGNDGGLERRDWLKSFIF